MSPKSARGGGHLAPFGTIARLKGNLAPRQVPFRARRGKRNLSAVRISRIRGLIKNVNRFEKRDKGGSQTATISGSLIHRLGRRRWNDQG